jgi:hypothetical protein
MLTTQMRRGHRVLLRALDRELKMTGAPERIREVSGMGYARWR